MIFCVDENERANRIVSLASLVASRTRVSRVSRVVSSESAPPRATHLRVHPAHGLRQRIRGVRHGARCLPSSRSPILARVRGVRRDRGVARARLRRRTRRLAPIWRDDSTGNGSRCASDASEGARVTLETSAAVRGDADARRGARRGAVANAIFKLETR
jgi:hypothetical protein|tara:strand:+ start:7688 stop:8164 length:477 start_codon:yes stop_codon:yes gene_type:complete